MQAANHRSLSRSPRLLVPLLGGAALLVVVGIAVVLLTQRDPNRQAEVVARGAQVMPFDLTRTTHYFTDAADGGQEVVVAHSATDTEQIALIQSHLAAEARQFAAGDFSDPAAIHGDDMPGLRELRAGADRISFVYEAWPVGGAITYRTTDPALIAVLHRWFAAQRSDHGAHPLHHL